MAKATLERLQADLDKVKSVLADHGIFVDAPESAEIINDGPDTDGSSDDVEAETSTLEG